MSAVYQIETLAHGKVQAESKLSDAHRRIWTLERALRLVIEVASEQADYPDSAEARLLIAQEARRALEGAR